MNKKEQKSDELRRLEVAEHNAQSVYAFLSGMAVTNDNPFVGGFVSDARITFMYLREQLEKARK